MRVPPCLQTVIELCPLISGVCGRCQNLVIDRPFVVERHPARLIGAHQIGDAVAVLRVIVVIRSGWQFPSLAVAPDAGNWSVNWSVASRLLNLPPRATNNLMA